MKVSGAKQTHYESGPNMTPLVDVVMVILIFLMLAGSFGNSEHYMVSSVPIHASGGGNPKPPPPGWKQPVLLDLKVTNEGATTVPGVDRAFADPDKLKDALVAKLAGYTASGTSPDDVEIVLRPTDGTRWEALAPIYDAALRAKFKKVGFAMTK